MRVESLLGMVIWYDILFAINMLSEKLQSKFMCINSLIKQIKSVLLVFEPMILILLILIWLCEIVWGVLLSMLWEAFLYNSFVLWTCFVAWIKPLRAHKMEVFHIARSCLMGSTGMLSENQLFLKFCMMRARPCLSLCSSSTPMLDEHHARA